MLITYDKPLSEYECFILTKNGWICKIQTAENAHSFVKDDDCGVFADYAEKEFSEPKFAMFEIEALLSGIDVIDDTDQCGCTIHYFYWYEGENRILAGGWDCSIYMFDAEETPRETAIKYQKIRNQMK